jgi:hypothetical protein
MEVRTNDLDSLIDLEAQIKSTSKKYSNILPDARIKFEEKCDWGKDTNKSEALIAIWFVYEYFEHEKDEIIIVCRVGLLGYLGNVLYTDLQIREARMRKTKSSGT